MPSANGDTNTSFRSLANNTPHKKMNSSIPLSDSDSEFEDTHMETPLTLREASRSFTDGIYVRTTTTVPLKDHLTSVRVETPPRSAKKAAPESYSDEERELIRKEKLITDDNEFSPRPQPGSPARRMRASLSSTKPIQPPSFDSRSAPGTNGVHDSVQPILSANVLLEKDLEFDPSDRELPEKRRNVFTSPERPILEETYKQVTKTPQRLSPLRNEIIASSSSVKSTAEELANEIKRSGATRSRSTQEIIDQINTSIDRMRDIGGEISSDDDGNDEEEEILRKLDLFLPKTSAAPLDGSPSRRQNGNVASSGLLLNFSERFAGVPQDFALTPKDSALAPREPDLVPERATIDSERIQVPLDYEKLPSPDFSQPRSLKVSKRRAAATSRKLSGKYARDVLRKRKLTEPSGKYESWLHDKWDKLKRLVELSVPNNVIINNTVVLRELGCKNKEELAQRVKFLARNQK